MQVFVFTLSRLVIALSLADEKDSSNNKEEELLL